MLTLYKQKVICLLNEIMPKMSLLFFFYKLYCLEGRIWVLKKFIDGLMEIRTCSIIVIYMKYVDIPHLLYVFTLTRFCVFSGTDQ